MPWRADRRADGGPGAGALACERARDRIDPYLEDELPRREAGEVEAHLARCPDCRAELAMARRLREAMPEGLPMLACPPEVTARVLAVARAEAERTEAAGAHREPVAPPVSPGEERGSRRWRGWLGEGWLRPALVAAAMLLLLVAAPLLYRAVAPAPPEGAPEVAAGEGEPAYSAEEIARAEEEARLVLAYVASVGRDAGRAVQEEVFADGIGRPARRMIEGLEAAGLGVEPSAPSPGETPRERRTP
jgi:hypothetical protein